MTSRYMKLLNGYGFASFKNLFPLSLLIFSTLGILEILYFQSRGLGNDFSVFYKAANAVLNGENPWMVGDDKLYSAYLNGPLASVLIACFGLLKFEYAIFVARLLSVFLIPYIVKETSKLFLNGLSLDKNRTYSISSILLLSFPVRANLEYGQLFIIFLALFVASVSLLSRIRSPWRSALVSGAMLEVCIEYKPQVFLFYAAAILIKNRRVALGILLTGSLSGLVSTILTRDYPFRTWLIGIKERSGGGISTSDQMNLYVLLTCGFLFIFLLVLGSYFFYSRKSGALRISSVVGWNLFLNFVLLSTFLNFYLHPTDIFFVLVLLGIAHSTNPRSVPASLAMGLALVWSNNPLVVLISILIVFLLVGNFKYLNILIWLILPNALFIVIKHIDGNLETRLRQTLNFIVVIAVMLSLEPSFIKSKFRICLNRISVGSKSRSTSLELI